MGVDVSTPTQSCCDKMWRKRLTVKKTAPTTATPLNVWFRQSNAATTTWLRHRWRHRQPETASCRCSTCAVSISNVVVDYFSTRCRWTASYFVTWASHLVGGLRSTMSQPRAIYVTPWRSVTLRAEPISMEKFPAFTRFSLSSVTEGEWSSAWNVSIVLYGCHEWWPRRRHVQETWSGNKSSLTHWRVVTTCWAPVMNYALSLTSSISSCINNKRLHNRYNKLSVTLSKLFITKLKDLTSAGVRVTFWRRTTRKRVTTVFKLPIEINMLP